METSSIILKKNNNSYKLVIYCNKINDGYNLLCEYFVNNHYFTREHDSDISIENIITIFNNINAGITFIEGERFFIPDEKN